MSYPFSIAAKGGEGGDMKSYESGPDNIQFGFPEQHDMCSPEVQTIGGGGGGGGGGAVQTKVAVLISWDTAATVSENQIFHRDSHKELLVIYSKSLYISL